MNEFIARVGTFFYLMAVGLLVLFIASDAAAAIDPDTPIDYDLFFISLILFIAGFMFRKRAAPPERADRFRSIRRYRENQKKKKAAKDKAKKGKPKEDDEEEEEEE